MKRKITVAIIGALLLVLFIQAALADDSGLCFTATNDKLLGLNFKTEAVSGVSYVPATAFSPFVSYSYFTSDSVAMLFTANKQIFFNLTNGNSYDSNENYYSVSATIKNGQVYVPVNWVCNYFGLSYSFISGYGYGDVLRIKNGAEVLSDSEFLDAASSLMLKYKNEYYGVMQSPAPSPSPSPSDDSSIDMKSASASICFIGIPSKEMLDSLDNYSAKVCFFVTSDEVSKSPDIVRRICGSGHSIGIYCTASPESECQNTSDMIFDAAQIRPVLITSPADLEQSAVAFGNDNGYAYFKPVIEISDTIKSSTDITSKLEKLSGYTSILIPLTEKAEDYIPGILHFLSKEKINVLPLLETMT